MHTLRILALSSTLLAFACGSESEMPTASPSAPTGATYYEDIAPLMNQYCQQCHEGGAIAPFALDTYSQAKQWGAAMTQAVSNRTMPPYAAVNDGSCQDFVDSPWLSDEEIQSFVDWETGGFQEGDPANAPAPIVRDDSLQGTLTTYSMAQSYTPVISGNPGESKDDYRCFLLDPNLENDAFVTGAQFLPGNATIVHHAIFFTVDPNQIVGTNSEGGDLTNGQQMQNLDQLDPDRAGWPCYSLVGDQVQPNGLLTAWAPGQDSLSMPEGTGLAIREGDQLVAQLHYNLDNGAGSDQSSIILATQAQVEEEAYVVLYDGLLATLGTEDPFVLEPGKSSIPFLWSGDLNSLAEFLTEFDPEKFPTTPERFRIHGIYPHGHEQAESMCINLSTSQEAPSDSSDPTICFQNRPEDQCLINVPSWEFNWQHFYTYNTPIEANSSQYIHMKCSYNTVGQVQPIWPGESSTDEMCLIGIYFTIP